jgi:hypothetical protein
MGDLKLGWTDPLTGIIPSSESDKIIHIRSYLFPGICHFIIYRN